MIKMLQESTKTKKKNKDISKKSSTSDSMNEPIYESTEQAIELAMRTMKDQSFENQADGNQDDTASIEIPVVAEADAGLPNYRELTVEEMDFYSGLIEAILFTSNEPLSVSNLSRQCNLDRTNTRILVDSLVDDYSERGGGISLREVAGGYLFVTSEAYSSVLSKLAPNRRPEKMTRSVIETLSIVAYRQPITLPEIEEVRGVNSRAIMATLLQRKLVKPQGYRPVPGRPTLYVTTRQFLMRFHLNTLADLPPLRDLKELPFGDEDDISLD